VVEVKTTLSGSDAESIAENMRSVKQLDKTAFYTEGGVLKMTKSIYGEEYELAPTLYLLFAFESSDLDGIREALSTAMDGSPLSQRVDCGVVLSRGVFCWQEPSTEMVDGAPGGPQWTFGSYDTEHALLLFYVLTARYLFQLRGGLVDLHKYLPPGMSL